ncbi:MAG: 30S ribosomal protein S5 [Candidatus Omnitrophica bacterium]|nr:30S ribosomal protein S5 [Candidatus Omnitrophota bacterium]
MRKEAGKKENAFIEKVLFINRVTKVTKGGKNLGFSALVVVGDGSTSVGYALGKANEVAEAIRKGVRKARTMLVSVKKDDSTIPHEVVGEFGAIRILFKPASKGTGVIACSHIRAVCECIGIKDILTKILTKSTNPVNVVKATFAAFDMFKG